MVTKQGSLDLLNDPVAQQLLQSHIPVRLSYVWSDGTPRVVPIGFHWTGTEFAIGTFPDAPKMHALKDGDKVALSIDSDTMPCKVLLVRGSVRLETVEGIAPEYAAMTRRIMDEASAEQWLATMRPITPHMAMIYVRPEWVGIIDFETRFPSALERRIEHAQADARA
jgi:hypothetical protein